MKRVVYLSSIGADMDEGNGLIVVHHRAEKTLNRLPANVTISFIRPAGFYKNLLGYVQAIKNQHMITASYGGDDRVVWVSNVDIADAIVDELESPVPGRKVRYVASDELACHDAARILGAAIGKPDLNWLSISDQQQLNDLMAHGMSESIALQFVEMNAGIHDGRFYQDYNRHTPTLGKVKMTDFAEAFAAVYHQP